MSLINKIKDSCTKPNLDSYLDPTLFWTAANGAYIYGADKALDWVSQNTNSHEGIAMLSSYLGLTLAWPFVNKYAIVPVSKAIRKLHKNRHYGGKEGTKLDWFRTLAQVGALTGLFLTPQYQRTLDDFKYDGQRIVGSFARNQEVSAEEVKNLDRTPSSLTKLMPTELDLDEVKQSNPYSDRGKFLRTYRWDRVFSDAERREGIEENLLPGLAMRESGGNPLVLNSSGDGGAGLMQFQPGTARRFGLKVYGNSHATGIDRNHGLRLRNLASRNRWNYNILAAEDERFDVTKAIDAAARYLKREHNRHGSWDEALSAYNRGRPALIPSMTEHVREARRYQRYYDREKDKMQLERIRF